MTPPPKRIRATAFALAAAAALAAAPAGAGLRDSFENARDAVGCAAKATFNPLRVFEWGSRNIDRVTGKEFDRKANRSVKEALDECRAAAESIVSRGLGVEKFAGKARGLAASAKDAADRVAGWFGKGAAPGDRRRALAVGAGERRFYEDAGVLGSRPLPEAKAPAPPLRRADGTTPGGWDDVAPARNPWGPEENETALAGAWDPPAADRDPWGEDEAAARDPFAPDPDADDFDANEDEAADEAEGGGYAEALATLERRAEEARQRAEREAELARRRAEREAELARRQAEREAELARRQAQLARRQAEREAEEARRQSREALRSLTETAVKLYAAKRGYELPSTALPTPSPGGGFGLFQADSSLRALQELQERDARDRERQRQENERRRRQWEAQQEQQRQVAAQQRRQRETQQERQRQDAERRQRERQAQQERQQQEAERRQRERQAQQERQRREAERQRRIAKLRERQRAALAGNCVQFRRLKGGFNVSDIEARSACGYGVHAIVACRESPGNSAMPSLPGNGRWRPVPSVERCRQGAVVLGACRAGTGLYPARLASGRYTCR